MRREHALALSNEALRECAQVSRDVQVRGAPDAQPRILLQRVPNIIAEQADPEGE